MSTFKHNRRSNRIVNIPNALSLLRVLLTLFIFYYLSKEDGYIEILILALIAILTDFFDGYLARKLNQISDWGKILDPVADKIAIAILCVGLVFFRGFPWWALSLIILRDVVILIFAFYVMKKREYIPVSNMLGKVTVTVYAALIVVYIFDIEFLKWYVLWLSMIFLILSLYGYYRVTFVQSK